MTDDGELASDVAGIYLNRAGREVQVDLRYPRSTGQVSRVVVGLEDVRAADDLVIEYDFTRDGWSITRTISVDKDGGIRTELGGWRVEVAFVAAYTEPKQPRTIEAEIADANGETWTP